MPAVVRRAQLPAPRTGRRAPRWLAVMLLTAGASVLSAAELTVMSAGAVEAGLAHVLDAFRRTSGHTVTIQYGTGPQLAERLGAGQASDVLIAPVNVMDQAIAAGRAVAATRVTVGRVGIGVMVRADGVVPPIATADALRAAILAADRIVYTRGSSGQYIDTMLAGMGVQDTVKSRLHQLANGEAAIAAIAAGSPTAIGFGAITEIRAVAPTVRLVGPLPQALQNLTAYDGAVRVGARQPDAAAAFLRFATSAEARRMFLDAGVQ